MLTPAGKKFTEAMPEILSESGVFLKDGYKVSYGNFSSREENGVKVRDATLHFEGKAVAFYDAATNEIYS